MKIRKDVGPGYILPDWYGVAWVNYYEQKKVCYPIPLNYIFGFFYWIYRELKGPFFVRRKK
jgi:hypothetical protein